jgi:hypothetical protein
VQHAEHIQQWQSPLSEKKYYCVGMQCDLLPLRRGLVLACCTHAGLSMTRIVNRFDTLLSSGRIIISLARHYDTIYNLKLTVVAIVRSLVKGAAQDDYVSRCFHGSFPHHGSISSSSPTRPTREQHRRHNTCRWSDGKGASIANTGGCGSFWYTV